MPATTHCAKTAICAGGQAPSHGMVPACKRLRMAAACLLTSSYDHKSKANRIDSRSMVRNSVLMCRPKLGISPGPGSLIVAPPLFPESDASAEIRAPGFALQTHHHRGTGMFGGGIACSWEFSLPMRDPHSR